MLEKGGPVLSLAELTVLLVAAENEGMTTGVGPIDPAVAQSDSFQRQVEDIYAAIALHGPARAFLPEYIAEQLNMEDLLSEEIAEITVADTTAPTRAILAKTYEKAFDAVRTVENGDVAGLDRKLDLGDAEYYRDRLVELIDELVGWLEPVFGHYVDMNRWHILEVLNCVEEDRELDLPSPQHPDVSAPSSDLLAAMGLVVRPRLQVERDQIHLEGVSYTPRQLLDFDNTDRMLSAGTEGFEEFAIAGILRRQFSMPSLLRVHAFWKSLFELTNMLNVAYRLGSPIYLPSFEPVAPKVATTVPATTADAVQLFRLFLSETVQVPGPRNLRELGEARRNPGLSSLREMLAQWQSLVASSDDPDFQIAGEIKRDIEQASSHLKVADRWNMFGRITTFVSLPIAAIDAWKGTGLGFGLAAVGPAVEAKALRQRNRSSWVKFTPR